MSKVESAIVQTFNEISKKLDQKSASYLSKVIPIDEGKENLLVTEPLLLLQYIKQICTFLTKSKMELEDQLGKQVEDSEYEKEVQKLEADVRQHIRVSPSPSLCVDRTAVATLRRVPAAEVRRLPAREEEPPELVKPAPGKAPRGPVPANQEGLPGAPEDRRLRPQRQSRATQSPRAASQELVEADN